MKNFFRIALFVICLFSAGNAAGQITTLFEYPVAPDTCTSIESRCNYSVQHFWDKCELTKPFAAENDSLLMEAMKTYIEIMRAGANVNVSLGSVRNLMFKAQANHDNFLKLAGIAEYLLYYHDTDIVDDLYLTFAQSVADASWAKKEIRNHFSEQIKRLNTSKLGQPLLDFEYTSITGSRKQLSDNRSSSETLYVVLFSDGESGSSIERMRLSTDITFGQLVDEGHIKVINIVLGDAPKQWDTDSQNYSEKWEVGASKDVAGKLDIRIMPCIFVLDEDFRVIAKNKTVDYLKNWISM
ncbi:MAG: DUF5106 domain-containing protein [Muribaculaceae bacterium]|nr:DUF5106 domain-containing protein [Muribaculaceae bacterium]